MEANLLQEAMGFPNLGGMPGEYVSVATEGMWVFSRIGVPQNGW